MVLTRLARLALTVAVFAVASFAQRELGVRPTDSGGVLSPEQAAFDVRHYDLAVAVDTTEKRIRGTLTATVRAVNPLGKVVLDLDSAFSVSAVSLVEKKRVTPLKFNRTNKQIEIELGKTYKIGQTVAVRVAYSGQPKVAPRPPWVGGFVWSKTPSGAPWFATAVQNDGADLWWPVKDHPSDKAETSSLHFTVEKPLVAAANGKLKSVTDNGDGTQTWNWEVSQPISNYCIALNVAPYQIFKDTVRSVTGEDIPLELYLLPENAAKAPAMIALTKKYNAFFEQYLGPYPFRADKIGIAETPHLGMEHQSIIAYGNEFKFDANGDDWLLFHEFGHEWWANLATAPDWNDFWIHEGFQSFFDSFYIEKTKGKEAYFNAMKARVPRLKNVKPVAPRTPQTSVQMYMLPPDYINSDGDIYGKGALVLHTLRFYLGDDAFFRAVRRLAYPDPDTERITNGRQFHFATTDDFLRIAERESGKELDWFFEVYLRNPKLPSLQVEINGNVAEMKWMTENNLPFKLPVEVRVGGETRLVEMKNGSDRLTVTPGAKIEVDPNGWLLAKKVVVERSNN